MTYTNITLPEAAEVLKLHNQWRRGEIDDTQMQCPKDIGNAIDLVVNYIESEIKNEKN
jgi:hypothetical protein